MKVTYLPMNRPSGSSRRQEAHSTPTRSPGKRSEPRYLGCYVTLGGVAAALALSTSALAQTFTVTNITVPGALSLAVSSMNASGHVAGYGYNAAGEQHAFVWRDGDGQDLGTLGGSTSVGNCLNNFGQVAGYSSSVGDTEYHAFSGIGLTLFDLGTLGGTVSTANWISDAGHLTGYSFVSPSSIDSRAFLIRNAGALQDLGTLGGTFSSGTVVNNSGQVAGDSSITGDGETHAFFHDGSMRDLGTLGGIYSSAHALNDAGHVAGESTLAGEAETHAFWFDGTTVHDLGTLGGTYSTGYEINDASQIVGDSFLVGDTRYHGFFYDNGTMTDLGSLGGNYSSAWAINNSAQVVGVSSNSQAELHAFVWQNGSMLDLNSLLPANSGWELSAAHFINDNGQIVGVGRFHGQDAWFLLTPRPNQSPVANAGPDQNVSTAGSAALVNLDGSASSDPDGDALQYLWSENGVTLGTTVTLSVSLGVGSHTLTLRVTDPHDAAAEDTVVVVVVTSGSDMVPPVVSCPENQAASAGENGLAAVPDLLSGLVASDNLTEASALVKTQSPVAGTLVECGSHHVLIGVTDAAGNTTTCDVVFTVSDTTAPVLQCPEEITRAVRAGCFATVPDLSKRLHAYDNCTPTNELRFAQEPAAGTLVRPGSSEIHVSVTDAAGNTARCAVPFHAVDASAPRFRSLRADPLALQATANHSMVPVTLTAVAIDNCTESLRYQIVAVTSSELVTGEGDRTSPDWQITGDLTLKLRAEVTGSCRIYTVRVACSDAAGNTSYRNVHVRVAPLKKK